MRGAAEWWRRGNLLHKQVSFNLQQLEGKPLGKSPQNINNAPIPRRNGALFISFWIVGQSQNVVHRHVVIQRQLNQNIRRNVPLTKLVVAVSLLGTV